MDDWSFEDEWDWEEAEADDLLSLWTEELADRFFLSDNDYLLDTGEDYSLGYLEPEDWWMLVRQLDELMDVEAVIELAADLAPLLNLGGVPTELLEDPLGFLSSVLAGNLPREASGRRVNSRRLVKIASFVVRFLQGFPRSAQAAVRAWADVHRRISGAYDFMDYDDDEEDLTDLLFAPDMPPAMTGFSMMIALTLMRWPERAEGLPLPNGFADPDVYGEVLTQWQSLPDSPTVTEEGSGEAEALFAQGQLAHMLAQMGAVELMSVEDIEETDLALAYSRLSRAILWIHNQCRHCPEREGIGCKVATNWPERPVPLLDVAGEVANTGRVGGCIKM